MLEAIAPGRIDLGLGRAPGSDGRTAFALNPNAARAADMFPTQVRDLMAWSSGRPLPAEHPFRDIMCQPQGPTSPEIWILGSSTYGAQLAGYFGLPYCYAHFFTDGEGTEEALDAYRRSFTPSAILAQPHCCHRGRGFGGGDAGGGGILVPLARRGSGRCAGGANFSPLPTPEEAERFELTEAERARMAAARERALIGAAPEVAARLQRAWPRGWGLTSWCITTGTTSPAARIKSYELFAREFGLPAGA